MKFNIIISLYVIRKNLKIHPSFFLNRLFGAKVRKQAKLCVYIVCIYQNLQLFCTLKI